MIKLNAHSTGYPDIDLCLVRPNELKLDIYKKQVETLDFKLLNKIHFEYDEFSMVSGTNKNYRDLPNSEEIMIFKRINFLSKDRIYFTSIGMETNNKYQSELMNINDLI